MAGCGQWPHAYGRAGVSPPPPRNGCGRLWPRALLAGVAACAAGGLSDTQGRVLRTSLGGPTNGNPGLGRGCTAPMAVGGRLRRSLRGTS
eukprot:126536-Pyramimonas_sp.AAC.1